MEYDKLYYLLFNAITDAVELLRQGDAEEAEASLIRAQQTAEELFMEGED